jgi:hypothetical protein
LRRSGLADIGAQSTLQFDGVAFRFRSIKKSVNAPLSSELYLGRIQPQKCRRVFVTNKISIERKQSNMLAAAIATDHEF